jgi:hypothetical protein
MIEEMKETMNGKSANIRYIIIYYVLLFTSVTCNLLIIFGNRPFHAFFVSKRGYYDFPMFLLDLVFLTAHMLSSSFCQLCFIDMCLTRIAKFRRPGKVDSGIYFGSYPREWTSMAFTYFVISELAFAMIVTTNLYGRFLNFATWSVHSRCLYLATAVTSMVVTLLGMLVLSFIALTVPYWKSTIKRNASISEMGKQRI